MNTLADSPKIKVIEAFIHLIKEKNSLKVSMDELAKAIRMSKKTIYTYFSSKEELLEQATDFVMAEIDRKIEKLYEDPSLDVIGIFRKRIAIVAESIRFLNNDLLGELQLEYPYIWKKIDAYREKAILEEEALINQGIQLGIFKELDPQMVAHLFLLVCQECTSQDFLYKHRLTWSESMSLTSSILLEGILKNPAKMI